MENILDLTNIQDLRTWLENNSAKEKECWVKSSRNKQCPEDCLPYLAIVEQALCFGWIDSTCKKIDGGLYQRLSPRKKSSPWTELNKERIRRLEKLGMMTDNGRKVLPDMNEKHFKIPQDIKKALQKDKTVWQNFNSFPPLYQRVKINNIEFYRTRDINVFNARLEKLILMSKENKMYGNWDDNGKLSAY
ncbi:MAG: YdeI/OmpD-associated family protein [Bacteroidales bacterium]|nr:YdeI/OmpD-associated family protein [Bacteroidales bacterium]